MAGISLTPGRFRTIARGGLTALRWMMITVGLMVSLPALAYATMAVMDIKAIAEFKKQLEALTKQLEVLTDARDLAQDSFNTIGDATHIIVPFTDLTRLTGQLVRDGKCLLPDYESLFPKVDFDGIGLGTICERRSVYAKSLLLDPEKLKDAKGPDDYYRYSSQVLKRRLTTVKTSAIEGLAQADQAMKNTQTTTSMISDLKRMSESSEDMQQRLADLSRGQLALLSAQNQTNQLLAQQLKVQSALAIALGLPKTEVLKKTTKEEEQ